MGQRPAEVADVEEPRRRNTRRAAAHEVDNPRIASVVTSIRRAVADQPLARQVCPGVTWMAARMSTAVPQLLGRKGADLIGTRFTMGDRSYCVEAIAPRASVPFDVGIWAYNTDEWASASEKLMDRCEFFERTMLDTVLAGATARKRDGPPRHDRENSFPLSFDEFKAHVSSRLQVRTMANPTTGWVPVEIHRGTHFGNAYPVELAEEGRDGERGDHTQRERDRRVRVVAGMQAIYSSAGSPPRIHELRAGTAGASFVAVGGQGRLGIHDDFRGSGMGPERRMWQAIWDLAVRVIERPTDGFELLCSAGCRLHCQHGRCHGCPLRETVAAVAADAATAGANELAAYVRRTSSEARSAGFDARGWWCVVLERGVGGDTHNACGAFTSPSGASFNTFFAATRYIRRELGSGVPRPAVTMAGGDGMVEGEVIEDEVIEDETCGACDVSSMGAAGEADASMADSMTGDEAGEQSGSTGGPAAVTRGAASSAGSSSSMGMNENEMEVEHDGASEHDGVRGAAGLDGASPAGASSGAPPPLLGRAGAASEADEMIEHDGAGGAEGMVDGAPSGKKRKPRAKRPGTGKRQRQRAVAAAQAEEALGRAE